MGTVATTSGFIGWFTQYGQVIYVLVQMVFWAVIGAAALIVANKYSQLVDFKTGKKAKKDQPAVADEDLSADDL